MPEPCNSKVVTTAIAIPIIPKIFPCLAETGDESPFRASINNTADKRYAKPKIVLSIYFTYFLFFLFKHC